MLNGLILPFLDDLPQIIWKQFNSVQKLFFRLVIFPQIWELKRELVEAAHKLVNLVLI